MEMLQLNDLHKTFNPGTVNEKVALNGVNNRKRQCSSMSPMQREARNEIQIRILPYGAQGR